MATAAQFITKPNAGTPATLTAANTATDGTSATGRALVFTAEAVANGGSVLPSIFLTPLGTQVKTIIRFFKNNGSDPDVAANNAYIGEYPIPAATKDDDDASLPTYVFDFRSLCGEPGIVLKGGASTPERLYATLATAVAVGIKITPINGGDLN